MTEQLHELGQRIGGVMIVVHDEHVAMGRPTFSRFSVLLTGGHGGVQRKPHEEGGALVAPATLGPDGSAVQLHDVPREREAKAQAAGRPRQAAVSLREWLEHDRKKLRRKACAG